MKQIKIVSYYSDEYSADRRTGSPAAINVINYISDVFGKIGYLTEVISPSWIISGGKGFCAGEKVELGEGKILIKAPSFRKNTGATAFFNKAISRLWITCYLLRNVKRNETIFLYHAPSLMLPINILRAIKKPRIIIAAEELYSDIPRFAKLDREKEIRFLKRQEGYVFPTELLRDRLCENKPYVIIHGTYRVEPERESGFDDGKIHVLYAGTLNLLKGGAAAAAAAAEYLDERYHVHIIGFGNEDEKKEILDKIEQIKNRTKAELSFDGLKTGEEYIRFLQSCHIGLSTQNPAAGYNETSFPSKVLSYLSNGLRVVSIRIKALECSAVSDLLYYYDEDTPQSIAQAIAAVDTAEKYDSRSFIARLDERACRGMNEMVGKIENG